MATTSKPKQPAQSVDPKNPGKDSTTTNANIYDTSGKLVDKVEVILKDGACYNKDTGQIMSDTHLGSGGKGDGTHNEVEWEKSWDGTESHWYPKEKPEENKKPSGGGGGGGGGSRPSPPPPPPRVEFNEPMPVFSSDLKKLSKVSYFFGIDDIALRHVSLNPNCCFISKAITINELKDEEYIELDASYNADENSSVEFYIVDGTNEIPIVPIKDKTIKNEKIFTGYETRFTVDKTKPVIIKRDGVTTNISLEEALQKNQNYVVSYTPDGGYQYKPFHTTIKLKIIIRNYKLETYAPCVFGGIKIRKYTKGGLWTA